jgi:outer membrane lipoprotein-sorting protein
MVAVRKFVPAAVVASLITAGALAIPVQAQAVDLPDISAEDLMSSIDVNVTGFSGTVVTSSNLGLPALEMSSMVSQETIDQMAEQMPEGFEEFVPEVLEQNLLTEAIAFAAGTNTVRLFASEEGLRAQILDPVSQRDIVVTETEFWAYDDSDMTALTRDFSGEFERDSLEQSVTGMSIDATDPRAVADFLMEQAGPNTSIAVGDDHMVAGREAYRLVLSPNSDVSLVDAVHISIDFETGMPLGVQVYSTTQADPALAAAFTQISFDVPDSSLFSFTAPPGATVEELTFPEPIERIIADIEAGTLTEAEAEARFDELGDEFAPTTTADTIGEGWETVMVLNEVPEIVPIDMVENELFADLMTEVAGGTVFSTPLGSILITNDGRVFAGAVTVDHLLSVSTS